MKTSKRLLIPLVLSASLLASCDENDSPTEPLTPAVEQRLIAQETSKWDLFFGTLEEKRRLIPMYADDFVSVGYQPDPVRLIGNDTTGLQFIPVLPKGSFTVSEMHVVRPNESSLVLSYKVTAGLFPTPGWSAWAASVWTIRGGEWKTVYYQATEIP